MLAYDNRAKHSQINTAPKMVEGVGFEPTKAEPSDLQSDPFDRSGTPPTKIKQDIVAENTLKVKKVKQIFNLLNKIRK